MAKQHPTLNSLSPTGYKPVKSSKEISIPPEPNSVVNLKDFNGIYKSFNYPPPFSL